MPRYKLIEETALRIDVELPLDPIDWKSLFGAEGRVEVEIGIGKGRFILASATARSDVHHFGVEWANRYLRVAETRAVRRGLENVRFARIDVRDLMPAIPDTSVSAFYVFYPDPWPKKRHHKRRFLNSVMATQLARTLTAGGALHVATDHAGYWSVIEPLFDGHADFRRLAVFGGDEFPLPTDEPLTNFETKYRVEGRSRHRGSWRRS